MFNGTKLPYCRLYRQMNTDQSAKIKALLERYRDNKCTDEEKAIIETWLNKTNNNTVNVNERAVINRIRHRVLSEATGSKYAPTIRLSAYLKIAAAILLVPAAVWLFLSTNKPARVITQYTTKRGERKTLILSDSTVVVLNSASRLRVNSDFNEHNRRVSLSGEAFFHVKHNAAKPFIVTTGQLQTRVLGTQFNVHAYGDEPTYSVAVVEGRVSVSEATANTLKPLSGILTRNLMITYNTAKHISRLRRADADKISSWQDGKLYFEEATVNDMTKTLARKYNIDIEFHGKHGPACRYTIGFNNQPLAHVLQVLAQLTGLDYNYSRNKIIIRSPNCN